MKILHPNNNKFLKLEELNNYYKEGFYEIISKEEKEKLNYFLSCFEKYRKENNERITDVSLYKNLPFSIHSKSWKAKQKDIKIIENLIGNRNNLKILDVGCWNGWLCNYLTKKGHQVVGTEIFTDEFDGLKAMKHYQNKFTLLQLLPEEIHRIQDKFDLIIFNRNWAYFTKNQTVFNYAKEMLSKNGIILFTGLTFYRNPKRIIKNLATLNHQFKLTYNIPILYKPSKGYLDEKESLFFKRNGIKLKSIHPLKYFIKKILLRSLYHQYGYFKNKK